MSYAPSSVLYAVRQTKTLFSRPAAMSSSASSCTVAAAAFTSILSVSSASDAFSSWRSGCGWPFSGPSEMGTDLPLQRSSHPW